MYFVYIIRSVKSPEQVYVGKTTNLQKRLSNHNSGTTYHTDKYKPWELVVHACFVDETKAIAFEQYLKSGSGREFRKRHFL